MPAPPALLRLARVIGVAAALLALSPSALAAPPAKPHAVTPKKGKGTKGHAPKPAAKAAPAGAAAPAPSPAEAPVEVKLDVHRATLDNGLRVVVEVNHASPVVAIAVVYDAGARDEERGRAGLSRLVERLMFQGSRNVGPGEHALLVAARGGESAAVSGADRTTYSEVLPAGELALGLWLEADRMRGLAPSPAAFDAQRRALQEEHRARVATAYEASRIRLEALVYQGYFPYEHAGLDLDGANLAWAQAFRAGHYGPGSAVLAIAGDVEPGAAMALVHRYFDDVPRAAAAPFADPGLPEQTSQRTAVIEDEHARAPGLLYGWAIPPVGSPEHRALDLAGDILAGGEGSRLHRVLVREKGLATSISAGAEQRRGPDLFRIEALLAGGAKPAEVERLIEAEIKALATRGPTEAELQRARRRFEAAFVLGLRSSRARARLLGEHELGSGDARLLAAEPRGTLAITGDDLKRAVAQHLGPTRRTVVETTPAGGVPAAPAAAPAHRPPAGLAPPAEPAPAHAPPPARAPKKGAAKPRRKKS